MASEVEEQIALRETYERAIAEIERHVELSLSIRLPGEKRFMLQEAALRDLEKSLEQGARELLPVMQARHLRLWEQTRRAPEVVSSILFLTTIYIRRLDPISWKKEYLPLLCYISLFLLAAIDMITWYVVTCI